MNSIPAAESLNVRPPPRVFRRFKKRASRYGRDFGTAFVEKVMAMMISFRTMTGAWRLLNKAFAVSFIMLVISAAVSAQDAANITARSSAEEEKMLPHPSASSKIMPNMMAATMAAIGALRITDLLAEQRRLVDAQQEFTEALAEQYHALADLQAAIGSTESMLRPAIAP